jgi:putative oxidoreductase
MPPDPRTTAIAAFLLRIALGATFLAHSILLKLLTFTLAGTVAYFQSLGLPGPLAYLVIAMEAAGGLLIVLGIQVRLVCLALLPILLGATWVHSGNGWVFGEPGGGWEFPAYLVLLAIVQILLGEGAFALGRSKPLLGR